VATAGISVQDLYGTRFTDVDGSSVANGQFKGVVITDAGDATEQTSQGKYQWSTDGSTWTDLAPGLTDATSVFLAPTTLIRFQAAAGVASINQHELKARLVDMSGQTSTAGLTNGQAGVNASVNGGSTAFSGTPIVLQTPAAGAPVNSVPGTQSASEDTQLAISGLSVTDPDGNLASTQLSVQNGTLNVTVASGASISAGTNDSGTLTISGTQSAINTTLASLKYQSVLNYNGADTLSVVSLDSSNISSGTSTVTINVAPINDQPTVTSNGQFAARNAGLEDQGAPTNSTFGQTVASVEIMTGRDVDGDSVGVAFVSPLQSTTFGTAWYSLDNGTTWLNLTTKLATASETNAFLLDATARVYFEGNANLAGTLGRATVRTWDGTDGATSGTYKNISALQGPSGAYSAATGLFNMVVTQVNDAPNVTLTTLSPTYSGSAANVFSNANVSVGASEDQNLIQFKMTAFGLKDGANERLTIDGTAITLTPGTSGTTTNGWTYALTSSAADNVFLTVSHPTGKDVATMNALFNSMTYTNTAATKTTGTRSFRLDRIQDDGGTENGGVDSKGSLALVGTVTVNLLNSAPVLADTALSFGNLAQSATPATPTGAVGVLVSSLLGGVTDADTADGKGMAITGIDTANGKLFYSTNGGTTWTQVDISTALSDARAFLIGSDADNRLYFQPNANYAGASNALTFRAWDKTAGGSEATFTNITATGGTTAFSAATDTVVQTVPTSYVVLTDSINGAKSGSLSGFSVSNAGDVNGDGYDDVIIGGQNEATTAGGANSGASYVVFGKAGNIMPINLSSLTVAGNSSGFLISGQSALDSLGYSVSSAGDINGDGLSDVIVGSISGGSLTGFQSPGRSYVVFGKTDTTSVDLSAVAAGSGGFAINGQLANDSSGREVSNAGDINGDGIGDLLIGSLRGNANAGTTVGVGYVVYGKTGTTSPIELGNLASSSAGFAIVGQSAGDYYGRDISSAGDVNGDGLADVIVGSQGYSPLTGSSAGRSYVVFGKTGSSTINLSAVEAGSGGFVINGQAASDYSGIDVGYAGDVNGDGLSDLIVSSTSAGKTYVVFGKTGTMGVDLSAVASGNGGYAVVGSTSGGFGSSVSSAGDLNGDGLSDLLIGAGSETVGAASAAGRTYVVYGQTGTAAINITAVSAGSGGFVINGQSSTDFFGSSVSNAGDLNGDGYDDLIVGAYSSDSIAGVNAGKSYVIYGGSQFISGNIATGTGTASDELVIGTSGNDTLTGNGGVDRFNAGKGNDTVVLQASDVTNLANNVVGSVKAMVDGGTGFDTLQVSAAGVNLDMTAISNAGGMASEGQSRINSIERINLGADATANTLTITAKDVNDMADFNSIRLGASDDGKTWSNVTGTALSATTKFHQVVVEGTSADTLNLGSGFALVGTVNNGTATYNVYQNTAKNSQVIADSAITNVVMDLAPTLVSTSPVDNSNVAFADVGNNLTLTFNEVVTKGTGLIQLYNASTNALVESFDAASSSLVTGWGTSTLTINPSANLLGATGYYVKVAPTAVQDLGGNAYAGITDTTTFNFGVLGSDGSIPVVPPYGGTANSLLGWSVSSAGDVNGDGYDDVIVGAKNEDATYKGAAYVIYGNASGVGVSVTGGTIASSLGFKISGGVSDFLGNSVTGIGDVNGDGFADLLVATDKVNSTTNTDAAYVVYGSATNANVDLASGTIPSGVGYKLVGGTGNFNIFNEIAGAGDFNGDGLADMIVSGHATSGPGGAYVVYGKTSYSTLNLGAGTIAASDGIKITGSTTDGLGWSVSGAGDVNGDGLSDVIISTSTNPSAFVVYGTTSTASIDLSSGTIASNVGFKLSNGDTNYGGYAITSVGDMNGDGFADVAYGAAGSGNAFVVYGGSAVPSLNLNLAIAPSNGFKISGLSGAAGRKWLSSAGDVNGDGLGDLIVGSYSDNKTYVVYGNTTGANIDLAGGTIASSAGFALKQSDTGNLGFSVSSAGDINGDGLADLIIGSPTTNSSSGAYYFVLGGTSTITTAVNLTGTSAAEAVMGTAGADTLIGGGGVDRFYAGKGNDTIVLQASDATNLSATTGATRALVSGGNGFDTVRLNGTNLDLTTISNIGAMGLEENSRIESLERIDMATDTAANTLSIAAKDVADMAGFNVIRTGTVSADGNTWANVTGTALSAITKYHQLVVDGTNVDTLSLSNNELWTKVGEVSNTGSVLASTHAVYQNNATNTQLIVDKRVNIQQLDFARVSISDNQTSATTGNNTQLTFTLKFSEAVDPSTLTTEDLNVVNGTLVPNSFTQVDSTTWTAQVTTPTSGSSATVLSLSDNSYKAMSTAIGLGGSGVQAYGALGTGASPGSGYSSGTNSYSAIGAFTNGSTVFAYSNGLTPWATQGGSLYPNGLYEFSYLTVELYRADGSSVFVENIDQASKWNGTRHTSPQVAQAGADGSFVVTWNFYGSNGYFYPYAQKYSADGVAVGPRTALATTGSFSTVVAPLGLDGSYSITWTESNVIKFQRFNADGTKTNYSLMTLDGDGNGADTSPQVISTGADGGSVVTWTGPDGSGQPTVFVQKVFANSGMSGLVKLKAPSASTNSDSQPDILVVGNSGEYVVTWTGKDEGGDTSIFVQKFNADGSTTGNAVVKLEGAGSTSSNDSAPKAYSIAADGSFALVWTVTGTGKYMQKFNADGTTNGTTAYVAPADAQVVVFDNGDYALSTLLNNNTIVTTKYSGAGVMLWTDSWFYPAPSNVSPWAVNGMTYTMVAQADGGIALGGVAAVTGTSYNSSDSLKFYVDYTSTGRAFVKTGTSGADVLVGTDGADYITAAGGADIVYAGAGNDSVTIDASNISSLGVSNNMVLDGGSGINKLILNTSTAQTLDLTNILVSSKVNGFTLIDLTTGTNTLTLSQTQAAVLSGASDNASTAVDESKMLIVNGNAGDGVQFMDGTNWSAGQSFTGNSLNLTYGAAFAFKSSSTYKLYTAANGATVFVNSLVTVTGNIAPVVLDMNGDGELSYARMLMDVNSDGEMDMTLWAGRQDGVLVWDKYHDGKVHNHTQYAFVQYGGESDLEGLAAMFDTNRDGQLNAADALFGEFKVWQDANQNGVSDAGELLSLTDAGIASINLVSDGVQRTPVAGVTEAGQTTATMVDGQSVLVADAAFVYETAIDADMAGHLAAQQSTDVTPEQVAAAIAVCTSAAESSVYSLSNGQSLDLTTVLKDMSFNGIVKGLEQVDMATDTAANVVSLSLADVLSMPPTNGVYKLVLSGAANDKVMLTEGEWTDTGNVVNQDGHNYAVYSGTTDPSAQLLIDQHMLQSHQTS
jgi:methionine-rich copper-binding protein CopC